MTTARIPDRVPIGDPFTGSVIKDRGKHLLTTFSSSAPIASGELVIRYGIPYLGKPHLSIVPGLIALDYGEMLTGEEAWDFVLTRSNLYPRADVVGYRNDGQDDMIPVKWLDLALPMHVLVYTSPDETRPLATIAAVIATNCNTLPQRLAEHIPCLANIIEWHKHEP